MFVWGDIFVKDWDNSIQYEKAFKGLLWEFHNSQYPFRISISCEVVTAMSIIIVIDSHHWGIFVNNSRYLSVAFIFIYI